MAKGDNISHNTTVFRAIRKSRWISDQGNPEWTAFVLNSEKGEDELSILTSSNCTASFCSAMFSTCYGEIELTAGCFLDIGLQVIETPTDEIPSHASVLGLPPSTDEAEARSLAKDILECVKRVTTRKFRASKSAPKP